MASPAPSAGRSIHLDKEETGSPPPLSRCPVASPIHQLLTRPGQHLGAMT